MGHPEYLPDIKTVTFHAALEARWEQLSLWIMSGLDRAKLVRNWNALLPAFHFMSEKLIGLGSQKGGMHIRLVGTGLDGEPKQLTWFITAENNHGPEIPCSPALILARKLARDDIDKRGATPCLNLFSLDDFDRKVSALDISWEREG